MKKIIKYLSAISVSFILLLSVLPATSTFAGSISGPAPSVSLSVGTGTTVYVTGNNVAGSLSVSSSNSSVASASASESWIENGSVGISIYAASAGSATIYISYSVADFDDDTKLYEGTYAVYVEVSSPVPVSEPSYNSGNSSNESSYSAPETPAVILSDDATLSTFAVQGHDIEQVDSNYYTLTVGNNISSLTVDAEANDDRAYVSGAGEHDLMIGENYIDVTVTAENGSQEVYTLFVYRKPGYVALEYLEDELKISEDDQILVLLPDNQMPDEKTISLVRSSGKNIIFYRYDPDLQKMTVVAESLVIDGEEIWITSEDGKAFTKGVADDIISEETEETTVAESEAATEPETESSDAMIKENNGFNVFVVISAVLAACIAAMLLVYFLKLRNRD